MPDGESGRVYIIHQLQVASKLSTKVARNHLLLSVTRRSVRCRSGSEISGAGLYECQGAKGRFRSVEGCVVRDELNGLQNWLAGSSPTATSILFGLGLLNHTEEVAVRVFQDDKIIPRFISPRIASRPEFD
jgi:hypothetical protein